MMKKLSLVLLALMAMAACDAPTTGQEIYDGDPETNEELPEDMQEKTHEEREDTTMDIEYDEPE